MSAYSPAPPEQRPDKIDVNLTDTISWGWYMAGALLPVVGFIAGIVFMAKSKIGPALALWATCFLAAMVWGGIYAVVEYNKDDSPVIEFEDAFDDTGSTSSDDTTGLDEAWETCIDKAQSLEEIEAC